MKRTSRQNFGFGAGCIIAAAMLFESSFAADATTADVCVYGATASGVAAAMAASDAGTSVVVVEPSRWLGGMSGGGLSAVDWGHRSSVGGLALKLLIDGDDPAMRELYRSELAARGIPVIYEHRLAGVTKEGVHLRRITLEYAPPDELGIPLAKAVTPDAKTVAARVFIDCSYEGDLMAKAGVSYTWGRESTEEYGESLAGVRPVLVHYEIDPYVTPGDPKSGLLPLLQDIEIGAPGSADKLVMMYAFRWNLTKDDPILIEKPDHYDPQQYEIFRRGFQNKVDVREGRKMHRVGEYEDNRGYGIFSPNSSRSLWAQSVAGQNTNYPDGDWAERSRIWREQMDFIRGMYHFLRTDPSVPEEWREKANTIGFKRGIFDDTNGWPHQLYVREARRMISDYVVTQKDLEGKTNPDDSIGLGSYGVDDWPYATIAHEGGIALSGGEFSILKANPEHNGIHKIPYRSITPACTECENLLVPVCCSASHIAMTSIRMEPVWIILGQSAGIAAASALKEDVAVQGIDFPLYRQALLDAGQVLEPGAIRSGEWTSQEEWNRAKRGFEWLFPAIDKDEDGQISSAEYKEFQAFKQKNPDWEKQVRERLGGSLL